MKTFQIYQLTRRADVLFVVLDENLPRDCLRLERLKKYLPKFLQMDRPEKVIISLERLCYINNSVVHALLLAQKALAPHGGRMMLCKLSPVVREVFRIQHLEETIFQIYDTELNALQAFGEPQQA